jgi:hypothetical protein
MPGGQRPLGKQGKRGPRKPLHNNNLLYPATSQGDASTWYGIPDPASKSWWKADKVPHGGRRTGQKEINQRSDATTWTSYGITRKSYQSRRASKFGEWDDGYASPSQETTASGVSTALVSGEEDSPFGTPASYAGQSPSFHVETLDDYLMKTQSTRMASNPHGEVPHAAALQSMEYQYLTPPPPPPLELPTNGVATLNLSQFLPPSHGAPIGSPPPPPPHPPELAMNIPAHNESTYSATMWSDVWCPGYETQFSSMDALQLSTSLHEALGIDSSVDIVELLKASQPYVYED